MASDVAVADSVTRPQIHVRGAVKSFAGRVVVDVDELVLGEQPIEGLIGPNGAGKTTLMRLIMHSLPLDGGRISLVVPGRGDVLLSSLPTDRMARHGVVKSNQVIMDFDKLTIWDSLLLSVTEARRERPTSVFAEQRSVPPARGGDAPLPRHLRLRRRHGIRALGRREEAARHRALPAPAAHLPAPRRADGRAARGPHRQGHGRDPGAGRAGHLGDHRGARPQRHLEPLRPGPLHGRGPASSCAATRHPSGRTTRSSRSTWARDMSETTPTARPATWRSRASAAAITGSRSSRASTSPSATRSSPCWAPTAPGRRRSWLPSPASCRSWPGRSASRAGHLAPAAVRHRRSGHRVRPTGAGRLRRTSPSRRTCAWEP